MTLNEKLAAFFRQHQGEWIDARRLLPIAGFAGWRTRVSDLRKPPYSMTIENRWTDNGEYRVSEYRYIGEAFVLTPPEDHAQTTQPGR